ncbi:hypothetical protein GCM10022291_22210 [Postechiella marina]|uniref:Sialate O-acetylesterase domain-containing protein n=1 Tax=Postechiella marina TaxID=943941 RepID=A0ABP8CAZ8_9FLAO
MMKIKFIKELVLVFCIGMSTLNVFAQDPNFHIYLCFGQSNMEGSAAIEVQDKTGNDRFKVLAPMDCSDLGRKQGQWTIAIPPLSQCWTGLSPADYFGRTMVENLPKAVTVGVINVAIGGSDIRLFDKDKWQDYTNTYPEQWFQDKINAYGANPYKRFIELAKQAQKDGIIKGILLHQGETNQDDTNWPAYVKTIYNNMLNDLSLNKSEVPLLVGELAHEDQGGKCASMNKIIDKLPKTISTAHVISSKGCEVRDDNVHFNSAGVRELGKRYALKMLDLQGIKVASSLPEPNAPYNIQVSRINNNGFTLTWDNGLNASQATNVYIEDPAKNSGNVYLKTLGKDVNSFTFEGKQTEDLTIKPDGVYIARVQALPDDNQNAYATSIVNLNDSEGENLKFDPNMHIYLCIGQSNMEGSAAIEPQDLKANHRFKVLQSLDCGSLGKNENRWYSALPPMFHCNTGLSPADYFGRTMVENLPKKIKVGVVPVAVGGCDIRLFDKDLYQDFNATTKQSWFTDKIASYRGNPYGHLINLAKIAQKSGVIKGILLHQGEANQDDVNWPRYVQKVYNNILADLSLNANDVPLLSGEVVHEAQNGMCASMNPIINKLPKTIPTAHVISSKGCGVKSDELHFNSAGVRELGKRYATKMLSLQGYKVKK